MASRRPRVRRREFDIGDPPCGAALERLSQNSPAIWARSAGGRPEPYSWHTLFPCAAALESRSRLPDDPTNADFSSRKRQRLAQGCIVLVHVRRLFRAARRAAPRFSLPEHSRVLDFATKVPASRAGGSGEPPHITKTYSALAVPAAQPCLGAKQLASRRGGCFKTGCCYLPVLSFETISPEPLIFQRKYPLRGQAALESRPTWGHPGKNYAALGVPLAAVILTPWGRDGRVPRGKNPSFRGSLMGRW